MKLVIVQSKISPYVDSVTASRLVSRFLHAKESWNTEKARSGMHQEGKHYLSKCKENTRKDIFYLKMTARPTNKLNEVLTNAVLDLRLGL